MDPPQQPVHELAPKKQDTKKKLEPLKLGLVLCNKTYAHLPELPGGQHDHAQMRKVLGDCRFKLKDCPACETEEKEGHVDVDLSASQMVGEFELFVKDIQKVARDNPKQRIYSLFYFSGHGAASKGILFPLATIFSLPLSSLSHSILFPLS